MDKIVGIVRINEQLMIVKLFIGKCLVNLILAYASQIGRSQEEKKSFCNDLYNLAQKIEQNEIMAIGKNMNGHVGKESDGYGVVHGSYDYGHRHAGGESILEFCDASEMTICGRQFKNKNKLIL